MCVKHLVQLVSTYLVKSEMFWPPEEGVWIYVCVYVCMWGKQGETGIFMWFHLYMAPCIYLYGRGQVSSLPDPQLPHFLGWDFGKNVKHSKPFLNQCNCSLKCCFPLFTSCFANLLGLQIQRPVSGFSRSHYELSQLQPGTLSNGDNVSGGGGTES